MTPAQVQALDKEAAISMVFKGLKTRGSPTVCTEISSLCPSFLRYSSGIDRSTLDLYFLELMVFYLIFGLLAYLLVVCVEMVLIYSVLTILEFLLSTNHHDLELRNIFASASQS